MQSGRLTKINDVVIANADEALKEFIDIKCELCKDGYITSQEFKRQIKKYYHFYISQKTISEYMARKGFKKHRVYLGYRQYMSYIGLMLKDSGKTPHEQAQSATTNDPENGDMI